MSVAPAQKAAINRRYYKSVRALVWAAKDQPCADCTIKYAPYVMQFDHRGEVLKLFNIGDTTSHRGKAAILEEIKKCDVVCANCHAERTFRRRQFRLAP